MRNLIRGIVVLALAWLEFILYMQVKALQNVPPEEVNGTKIMMMFIAITFVAIIIGTIFALTVIPAIGEAVGGFFFAPNQEVEKSPYADAVVKVAQGDFEGAVEEYHQVFESNPEDTHCVSEIVHIYCDKLKNPDAAEQYLNNTLQHEWPQEQAAFFANRLVDIYWTYKHDATSARHILAQIAETMPESRFAANALHRMHELDRAVANEEAGIRLHSLQSKLEDPAGDDV
jgi:tetratricopeptide (TPR) repeat protein